MRAFETHTEVTNMSESEKTRASWDQWARAQRARPQVEEAVDETD